MCEAMASYDTSRTKVCKLFTFDVHLDAPKIIQIFCGVYGTAVMEFRSLFFRFWRGAKAANKIYQERMATNTILDVALEHFTPLDRNGTIMMNSNDWFKAIFVTILLLF